MKMYVVKDFCLHINNKFRRFDWILNILNVVLVYLFEKSKRIITLSLFELKTNLL